MKLHPYLISSIHRSPTIRQDREVLDQVLTKVPIWTEGTAEKTEKFGEPFVPNVG